jgi:hypothetical protein
MNPPVVEVCTNLPAANESRLKLSCRFLRLYTGFNVTIIVLDAGTLVDVTTDLYSVFVVLAALFVASASRPIFGAYKSPNELFTTLIGGGGVNTDSVSVVVVTGICM